MSMTRQVSFLQPTWLKDRWSKISFFVTVLEVIRCFCQIGKTLSVTHHLWFGNPHCTLIRKGLENHAFHSEPWREPLPVSSSVYWSWQASSWRDWISKIRVLISVSWKNVKLKVLWKLYRVNLQGYCAGEFSFVSCILASTHTSTHPPEVLLWICHPIHVDAAVVTSSSIS